MRSSTPAVLLCMSLLLISPLVPALAPPSGSVPDESPAAPGDGTAASPPYPDIVDGAEPRAGAGANWTLMVYMAADNSREQGALDAVNELEAGFTEGSGVQVLVQLDRIAGYSNADGDWSGARRYLIGHDVDEDTIGSEIVGNPGEVNMASALTLADFLKWGISNYPAQHFAVVLWGHGYGVEGVLKDDTTGGAVMDVRSMAAAAEQAAELRGRPLDLWCFDADYMGLFEVAYSLKAHADVMVGTSELIQSPDGFMHYRDLFWRLDQWDDARTVGKLIIWDAEFKWELLPGESGQFIAAAWDLISLDGTLAEEINDAAQKLNHAAGTLALMLREPLATARDDAHGSTHPDLVDLGRLMYYLSSQVYPPGELMSELEESCRDAFNAAIECTIEGVADLGDGAEVLSTISIMLPMEDPPLSYGMLDSSLDTAWDEFIQNFLYPPLPAVTANEEPTVTLEYPPPGAYLTGTVRLEGSASDSISLPATAVGVDEVQVKLGRGPWQTAVGRMQWWADVDTRQVPNGLHWLSARSYDGLDYTAEYSTMMVAIGNPGSNGPPQVEIYQPGQNDRVVGMVDISGYAEDDDGVEYVEILIKPDDLWVYADLEPVELDGGGGSGEVEEPDMRYVLWSCRWDSSQSNNGPKDILARAGDGEMKSLTDTVTVRLMNPWGNQPPRAVITSPEEDGVYHTDESVHFDGTDSWDPDDDQLTYRWLSNTTGLLGDEAEFWAQLAEGKHYITLTVSDGVFESAESVNVTVVKHNTTTFLVWNFYEGHWDEVEASLTESGNATQIWVDVRISVNARDYHEKFSGTIRPGERELFGYEGDRDGDGDVWLLITDIQGNVAGYFMPSDPNGHDILYLDDEAGISVAAHEFNHMILHNYDPGEYGWISEGLAQFAEVYFYGDPRVNTHMAYYESRTDTTLDWRYYADDLFEVLAQYGVGFLFTYYFAAHFGGDETAGVLLRDGLSFDPAENDHVKTIPGVEQVLEILGYNDTFEEVYRDWGVANLVDDMKWGQGRYGYPGLDVAVDVTGSHDTYPAQFAGNINPWASEYHLFTGGTGEMIVEFGGDPMADYHVFLVGYADERGGEILFIDEMELDLNRYGSRTVENMTTEVGELYVVVLSAHADGPTGYTLSASLTSHNQVPTAEAGQDVSVNVGEYVHFDGGGSHDPDGDELTYSWDFDASDGVGADAAGQTPVYAYLEEGVYTVTLNVNDGRGMQANDTLTVTVRLNLPPAADAGQDVTVDVDELVSFDGGGSSDPEGDPLEYSWDLDGDGTPDASGERATWRYGEEGDVLVTLTVSDAWGGNSTDTLNVTVFHNDPPVAAAGEDISVAVGQLARFSSDGTYDPDGDVIYYSWDFDASDGVDPADPDATGPGPTHTYVTGGEYLVTLTVTDPYDSSATDTLLVAVNTLPEAEFLWVADREYDDDTFGFLEDTGGNGTDGGDGGDFGVPEDFETGQPLTDEPVHFTAAPSRDADGDVLSFQWHFGDGEVSSDEPESSDMEVEHVFRDPGVYRVTLWVFDGRGGNDSTEQTLQVTLRPIPPVPAIRYPSPGDEVSGTVEITGKCDDDGDVEDVELSMDGGGWHSVEPSGDDYSRWTYTWETDRETEGTHTITARSIVRDETSETSQIQVMVVRQVEDGGEDGEDEDEEAYAPGDGGDEGGDNFLGMLERDYLGLALWMWLSLTILLVIVLAAAISSSGKGPEPETRSAGSRAGKHTGRTPSGMAPGMRAAGLPPPPSLLPTARADASARGGAYEDDGEGDEVEEDEDELEEVEAVEGKGDSSVIFEDEQWADLRELVGDKEIFQLQCPGCRHRFPVIRGQREVTCPKCGISGSI